MRRGRVDPVAGAATLLAAVMLVAYLVIIGEQDGQPAAWAVVAFGIGIVGSSYGAVRSARGRRLALVVAGLVLVGLGLLALLTIGLPILVAGVLCLIALLRHDPAATRSASFG